MRISFWLYAILVVSLLGACGGTSAASPTEFVEEAPGPPAETAPPPESETPMPEPEEPFELKTSAFADGEFIPDRHACTGENLSPEFTWGAPPAGTQSLAMLMDDPDAGSTPWVHWVLYNLPPETRGLPEGLGADEQLADGSMNGSTSFGSLGYGGPCPPTGAPHHYNFMLYALDTVLDLEPGATKSEMLAAMEGHILAQATYTGLFSR